uniref:Gp37-like protein n=2 Tax=Nocardia vaccinii TaxID=1822 RepID=UPI0014710B97|nr:hypothetical protein [Nocardia vaccinii]
MTTMTPPEPLTLADIPDTWDECERIREERLAMRRAKPRARVFTNPPDGREDEGLILVGEAADNIAGSFPLKNKVTDPGVGTLRLRPDHPISRYIINIPLLAKANPSMADVIKANVVLIVDHMGGAFQWSGLVKNWRLRKDANGIRYVELTCIHDTQFLQYYLCPPNPILPLEVFQWPRDLPLFGPSKWCISLVILLQLIRRNGNLWNIPEDPFDVGSWDALFDWSSWQVFIKANPFDLDDSSLWNFFSMRMDRVDQLIVDAMDDAQLTMQCRRVMTIDGETIDVPGVSTCRNGALVFEVVDNSGFYDPAGTSVIGNLFDGFARTVVSWAEGGVEDVFTATSNDNVLLPDEYYAAGWNGTMPPYPWVTIMDGPYTSIETSDLTHSPDTAVSFIVGGDNPLADEAAKIAIELGGDLLGFLLTSGFVDNAGDIAADVIMPFIQGCIFAWDQYTHNTRAHALGWVHLGEVLGGSANVNAWSLAAIDAFRAAIDATASETAHVFTIGGSARYLPFLDFLPGNRIGSTDLEISNFLFVDQVAIATLAWDYSQGKPHDYEVQVGEAKSRLTQAERFARMLSKMQASIADIGVHLLS